MSAELNPYRGDLGIRPYQEVIESVEARGGMALWSFPEARDFTRIELGRLGAYVTKQRNELEVARAKRDLKAETIFAALNLAGQLSGDVFLANGAPVLTSVAVMLFVPVAMVGARRYRLSRTSWRGIRFSFHGRTWDFIKLFVGGSLLTPLTLGLYYPVFQTKQQAFMVSHARFGQRSFRFDGRGRDLLRSYLLAVLLTLPTLGLCWFFQATTGLEPWHIWMAILVGHVTRATLSVARFRQEKWRHIAVDIEPPTPRIVTAESEMGPEPHMPMHDAPNPARRS